VSNHNSSDCTVSNLDNEVNVRAGMACTVVMQNTPTGYEK